MLRLPLAFIFLSILLFKAGAYHITMFINPSSEIYTGVTRLPPAISRRQNPHVGLGESRGAPFVGPMKDPHNGRELHEGPGAWVFLASFILMRVYLFLQIAIEAPNSSRQRVKASNKSRQVWRVPIFTRTRFAQHFAGHARA